MTYNEMVGLGAGTYFGVLGIILVFFNRQYMLWMQKCVLLMDKTIVRKKIERYSRILGLSSFNIGILVYAYWNIFKHNIIIPPGSIMLMAIGACLFLGSNFWVNCLKYLWLNQPCGRVMKFNLYIAGICFILLGVLGIASAILSWRAGY